MKCSKYHISYIGCKEGRSRINIKIPIQLTWHHVKDRNLKIARTSIFDCTQTEICNPSAYHWWHVHQIWSGSFTHEGSYRVDFIHIQMNGHKQKSNLDITKYMITCYFTQNKYKRGWSYLRTWTHKISNSTHISPSQASYGVSLVDIRDIIFFAPNIPK